MRQETRTWKRERAPCLGGCRQQGTADSVGRYICAPCTSRLMKADRAMKFAEVAERKRDLSIAITGETITKVEGGQPMGPISVPHCRVDERLPPRSIRVVSGQCEALVVNVGEPEKDERDRLLARYRELRKMSVMGGMSRADARELREVRAALDALDREASE